LSTQNPTQEEGSQAEGHTQTLNLDDWIITWKEYKPGRRKRSNKQNPRTRREKKLSHLGAGNGIEPGSDKPQPKIVRPIYVNPIKKSPDAQVEVFFTNYELFVFFTNFLVLFMRYNIWGKQLSIQKK
jgi:hypothetical protein